MLWRWTPRGGDSHQAGSSSRPTSRYVIDPGTRHSIQDGQEAARANRASRRTGCPHASWAALPLEGRYSTPPTSLAPCTPVVIDGAGGDDIAIDEPLHHVHVEARGGAQGMMQCVRIVKTHRPPPALADLWFDDGRKRQDFTASGSCSDAAASHSSGVSMPILLAMAVLVLLSLVMQSGHSRAAGSAPCRVGFRHVQREHMSHPSSARQCPHHYCRNIDRSPLRTDGGQRRGQQTPCGLNNGASTQPWTDLTITDMDTQTATVQGLEMT